MSGLLRVHHFFLASITGVGLFAWSFLMAADQKEKRMKITKLPKGTSAWSYSNKKEEIAKSISRYNAKAPEQRKFRYYFPWTGSVAVFPKRRKLIVDCYNRQTVKYFDDHLPGVMLLPTVDGRNDAGEFNNWTVKQYHAAAESVAKVILADLHAKGVQIDIEPFHATHIPFYARLTELLNAKGKITSAYIGNGRPESTWKAMFRAVNIMCGSGHETPGNGKKLEARLRHATERLLKWAAESNGYLMMGYPVLDGMDRVVGTGNALRTYEKNPRFIGAGLYALGDLKSPKPEVWAHLVKY